MDVCFGRNNLVVGAKKGERKGGLGERGILGDRQIIDEGKGAYRVIINR